MRYSKEFKLKCILKYKEGIYVENPGRGTTHTFHKKIRQWSKIYDHLGEEGLAHEKPKLTYKDKIEICKRVASGESMSFVAVCYGRQATQISIWYRIYLQQGIDGLISSKRGRPPIMKKEMDGESSSKDDESEQIKALKQELNELQIQNEYLKKLSALVQKRKDQQQKKK